MKRGTIALFRETNSPASKSRPCVVVQRDATLGVSKKITAVPLTTTIRNIPEVRPLVAPSMENGLREVCEVEIDWIFTFRRERLGPIIGQLDEATMRQIDVALRLWLGL